MSAIILHTSWKFKSEITSDIVNKALEHCQMQSMTNTLLLCTLQVRQGAFENVDESISQCVMVNIYTSPPVKYLHKANMLS